jgi:cell wall integrity and stress response component
VIKTIVITPSATPIAETKHKSVSTGAIVGGILGGLAGLLAIVGGVFFLLWRRRRQQQDDDGQTGIQRNVSTMSKSGLLRFGQANSQVTQHPSKISTAFNRHSRIPHEEEISPMSAPDRRNSRPYLFDQRLNPSAIMNLDNNSRGSFVSLDDSHDYGRTLNVCVPALCIRGVRSLTICRSETQIPSHHNTPSHIHYSTGYFDFV